MTVSAHNARRVYRGASLARNVSPGESPAASMFYELNPHLRSKEQKAIIAIIDKIYPWLVEHGPANAQQIAAGLGVNSSSINRCLRNGIYGVVVVGVAKGYNRSTKIWGVEEHGI